MRKLGNVTARRHPSLWFVGLAVAGAASLAWLASYPSAGPADILWAAGILLLLGTLVAARRPLDPFDPVLVFAGSFYAYCFIGPARVLNERYAFFRSVELASVLWKYYLLSGVAILGVITGVALVRRSRSSARTIDIPERVCVIAGGILCIAALLSFLGYYLFAGLTFRDRLGILPPIDNSGNGVVLGYLWQGLDFSVPGLALLGCSKSVRSRVALLCFSGVLTLAALTTGFRSNVVKTVAPVVIMLYLTKNTRPRAMTCLAAAMAAVLIFSFIGNARGGAGDVFNAWENKLFLSEHELFSDLNVVWAMTVVLDQVPASREYLAGSSFLYLPVHLLPRSLYPHKGYAPEVEIVWDVTDKSMGLAIPLFGLFYLNGGFIITFIGMSLVGVILARTYASYRESPYKRSSQVFLTCTFILGFLLFPRQSLPQIATNIAYMFGPVMLLFAYYAISARRRARGASFSYRSPIIP
jgi:oligosaccharide repeat unit polymerase